MITSAWITDGNWAILIADQITGGIYHKNLNKMNTVLPVRDCRFVGCSNTINIRRQTGLCNTHEKHFHDLHLSLANSSSGGTSDGPSHQDIIDALILWAKPRNFNLNPLFELMSFSALGNIPDVSTLSGDNIHTGYAPPSVQNLLEKMVDVINNFLPSTNNSSYQSLTVGSGTNRKEIPARVLALTFAGLVLCEEANRGDRWFNRTILKDESKTRMLGGAMPIAYFAAKNFNWGVEFGKAASRNLVPSN